MGAFKINGIGTGLLKGFRLLFECEAQERWMIDNVVADLERGGIEHVVRSRPNERGWQVWRTEVGWLDAKQREADQREVRDLLHVAPSFLEIQAERRLA